MDANPHAARLRFFNEVVYARLPGVYNALDQLTFGVWWRLVRRALEYVPPGGRVLEIGFGPGRLQVALARQSDVCVGLDLASGMCRYTSRRLRRAGLPSRIVRGDATQLPFSPFSFDCVVSTFALSGMPNGRSVLAEMARVTTVGGRVVLVDISLPQDGNRLGTSLARLWESMGDSLYDFPALMRASGLTLSHCVEYGPGKHIQVIVARKVEGYRWVGLRLRKI